MNKDTVAKELPIIMTRLESIRGTLDGTKTQTRRIISPQPPARWHYNEFDDQVGAHAFTQHTRQEVDELRYTTAWEWRRPRFGVPGTQLWVREPWRVGKGYDEIAPPAAAAQIMRRWYEADGPAPAWAGRLRHVQFMPRWASRIQLEVLEVRVQRVREISAADCRAEGVEQIVDTKGAPPGKGIPLICVSSRAFAGLPESIESWTEDDNWRHWFAVGWNQLHGRDAWDRNDFVEAITYRRVKP